MKSQICNAKKFCYIAPIVLNEVGKINVVCEGFVISETHDAYVLIYAFRIQQILFHFTFL